MQHDPQHRPPFVARMVDGGVLGFAGWTLLTNVFVLAGGGLDALVATSLSAGVGLLLVLRFLRHPAVAPAAPTPMPQADGRAARSRSWLALGVALAAAAVGARFLLDGATGYWLLGIVAAGLALVRSARETPADADADANADAHASTTRVDATLVVLLAAGSAIAVAIAHRADADDAFYLNLVVAAVDHPSAALLAGDTLHGYAGVPMSLPVFKVLSWEMLQAAIARLAGIDAIRLVHVLMPPLLAACVPLAYARLLRRLVPDRWSVALVLVMAQLFCVGDGVTSYGDFAFLRMHQGKALLLHIGLPLLTSYALDFAAAPSSA